MSRAVPKERWMSLQALEFWLRYYKNNPTKRPIWGDNSAVVAWLTRRLDEKRMELGIICL